MPSSYASRRRRRGSPASPEPHPEAVERAMGPAAVPRDAPPLPPAAVVVRELDPDPRVDPPSPGPPMTLPSSRTARGSLGRRLRRKAEGDPEARDWAELPLDVLLAVLGRLGQVETLLGPGQVCRPWRRAARDEPALWRRVDLRGHGDLKDRVNLKVVAKAAIRRAAGQCVSFWAEYAADNEVLRFLGNQAPYLRSLRLISCQDIVTKRFVKAIKKFPLLEELEISLVPNIRGNHVFELVGKACPELKSFRLNKSRFHGIQLSDTRGITAMHGLHSLQLFGNVLTNEELAAILDNCPHLELLDIRHCFNIIMDDALHAKCATIKTLRLPYDSTDDYDCQFEHPSFGRVIFITDSSDSDGDFHFH
ncbi:hypothetical protein ACP70R_002923 [Stipagrostis hirtigluma subsp. patula]